MKPQFVEMSEWNYKNPMAWIFGSMFGYNQYKSTEASTNAQISYNDYIKGANARALKNWNARIGSKGVAGSHPTIQYPEFAFAGNMRKADTGSYRAYLDSYTAGANYYGNLPYRGAGLFGISSRISRWL